MSRAENGVDFVIAQRQKNKPIAWSLDESHALSSLKINQKKPHDILNTKYYSNNSFEINIFNIQDEIYKLRCQAGEVSSSKRVVIEK